MYIYFIGVACETSLHLTRKKEKKRKIITKEKKASNASSMSQAWSRLESALVAASISCSLPAHANSYIHASSTPGAKRPMMARAAAHEAISTELQAHNNLILGP
jgi:hypothetical protein